jgi:hypothetical protein
MSGCTNRMVYRPRSVYLSISITFFIVAGLVGASIDGKNIWKSIEALVWGAFVMWGAYLLFIHPRVIFFDEGITIVNPFWSHTIGWDRVESVEAKFTMGLQVQGRIISAWAAPAPGRYHSRTLHPSDVKGLKIGYGGLIRPGESPRSDSGQASYLAKLRLRAFQEGDIAPTDSSRSINRVGILVLVGLFACPLVIAITR